MNRRTFLSLSALAAAAGLVNWRFAQAAPPALKPGQYHAVVIGAGLGGLSCAALLARHGFKTLVLEQHDIPGGYATSFTRAVGSDIYPCEVSLHSSCLTTPSSKALLEQLGVWGKFTPVAHAHSWVSHFPDFTLELPAKIGLSGFKDMLLKRFPAQAKGLERYFALWSAVMEESTGLDSPSMGDKALFPVKFKALWSIRNKTLAQVMDPLITDPQLKAVLAQSWAYYGLPPSKLSAYYYLMPTGEYIEYGGDYIKGTSQALSDALADSITAAGGEVLTQTPVSAILMENGRAVGVKTVDGTIYRADAVVCNAAAPQLFASLMPQGSMPKQELDRVAGYQNSLSSFVVWLGLTQDISKTFPYGHASYSVGTDCEAAYDAMLACDYAACGFGLMAYDNIVPGFSPKGRFSLSIISMSGYEPWRRFEADYLAGNKAAYHKEKQRQTDLLIRMAEKRAIPGLTNMIAMRDSATPLTNLRFTRNPGGAIYGYDQTVNNSFMNRMPNDTGVPGLTLASAWGNPGGGYGGVLLGGKQAFKDVAESLTRGGGKS
ncbi:FAD-dependent oxidoreductase [Fundidesulfovibrio butyratiphilus]